MMLENKAIKIGTHNGTFHCDEALAIFLLKQLPEYKDAIVVRTRDMNILDTCDIVVDVGGEYNPSKHRYDHHMRDFNESLSTIIKKPGYDSTIKLSSAGLIYCHFGYNIIKQLVSPDISETDLELIFKRIYDSLIKEIDGIDNGIPMYDGEPRYTITTGLSSRVQRLNPAWNESNVDEDSRFQNAIDLVGEEFLHFVHSAANVWLPARNIIRNAVEKRFEVDPSGEIIVLEKRAPWQVHLSDLENEQNIKPLIKYVIYQDNTFRVQGVPVKPSSFVCRMCLPEAWLGLRNEQLVETNGINGSIFVHPTGFIGGNETKEGALEMARKALAIGKSCIC